MRRSRPASASSTLRIGMAAIVVQFGFAMIPLRASAIACGLTSLTTSGTSGSIRHALELSITVTPAAANRGACREQCDVQAGRVGGFDVFNQNRGALERQGRACRA